MAFRSMGFRSMEIRPKVNTKLVVWIFFFGGGSSYGGGGKNHCILIFSKSITQDLKITLILLVLIAQSTKYLYSKGKYCYINESIRFPSG